MNNNPSTQMADSLIGLVNSQPFERQPKDALHQGSVNCGNTKKGMGFIFWTIIAIVIVAIIALTGFVIWKMHNRSVTPTIIDTVETPPIENMQPTTKSNSKQPIESQKMVQDLQDIDIMEWPIQYEGNIIVKEKSD